MNSIIYIYGLTDPTRDNAIFYVGRTSKALKFRLREHLLDAQPGKRHKGIKKSQRIKGILESGATPGIALLHSEYCKTRLEAAALEDAWIGFIGLTQDLTNAAPGICGGHNAEIRVSSETIAQLGTMSDLELAEKSGIHPNVIMRRRHALGIPVYKGPQRPQRRSPKPPKVIKLRRIVWTDEALAMLGKCPDSEIALFVGCSPSTVSEKRHKLSIPICSDIKSIPPNMGGWNKKTLPQEIVNQIGKMPDTQLAQIAGVDKTTIRRLRHKMGVPSYGESFGYNTCFKKGQPHPRWSKGVK